MLLEDPLLVKWPVAIKGGGWGFQYRIKYLVLKPILSSSVHLPSPSIHPLTISSSFLFFLSFYLFHSFFNQDSRASIFLLKLNSQSYESQEYISTRINITIRPSHKYPSHIHFTKYFRLKLEKNKSNNNQTPKHIENQELTAVPSVAAYPTTSARTLPGRPWRAAGPPVWQPMRATPACT
jgi:hypothetical protein